ncbi:MAG: hydrolase [Cyanobacteria bacterium RYN_339]|nr:hydrolase [Cyanobacteria bacterium RYN_339]
MATIDTLLLDLDGTLVDQVQPGSGLQFTWLVLRRFTGLAPWRTTYRAGHAAVHALQHHRSDLTNFEAMIAAFCAEAGVAPEAVRERVLALAEHDFPAMGWRFKPIPGARQMLETARGLGYRLVLATNPTVPFPMTQHRMRWAGIDDLPWAFIAHPQIMTRTKPDVAYYHELLAKLDCGPERCLMVGNDFRKDLPAMDAGIQTFLLDRPMSRKARKALATYHPDHFGSYAELESLLRERAPGHQFH